MKKGASNSGIDSWYVKFAGFSWLWPITTTKKQTNFEVNACLGHVPGEHPAD